MTWLDWIINIAEMIYLASYTVRDILWLRNLTVLGGLLLIPYYYFQPEPLWPAIAWTSLFTIVNLVWIGVLFYERRPVKLTDEEERLYNKVLRPLTRRQALHLFRHGTWETHQPGDVLQTEGQVASHVMLLSDGKVAMELHGEVVDTFDQGRFLGGTAYLTKDRTFVAAVTGKVVAPTRLMAWPIEELRKMAEKDEDFSIGLDSTFGLELSELLHQSWAHEELAQAFSATKAAGKTPPGSASGPSSSGPSSSGPASPAPSPA